MAYLDRSKWPIFLSYLEWNVCPFGHVTVLVCLRFARRARWPFSVPPIWSRCHFDVNWLLCLEFSFTIWFWMNNISNMIECRPGAIVWVRSGVCAVYSGELIKFVLIVFFRRQKSRFVWRRSRSLIAIWRAVRVCATDPIGLNALYSDCRIICERLFFFFFYFLWLPNQSVLHHKRWEAGMTCLLLVHVPLWGYLNGF